MSALRDAYELIKDQNRWTRGSLARTPDGRFSSNPESPNAVRWCAVGALQRVGCDWDTRRSLDDKARDLFSKDIVYVNDKLGHEAILQVFEKALTETEGGL